MKHLYKIIFLFLVLQANAQLETAHWRFGQFAGLNFTAGTASTASGSLYTNEGCASISDKCGNLLFYTDGKMVFSRDNTMMQNGNALLGDVSSTQSAIIIPNPDNPNIYYIFTTYVLNGVHYSVVDLSLNGGLGAVVSGQKNIPLRLNGLLKGSEKLTAVAKEDHSGYWVITHYLNRYYSFSVTAAGVNVDPVVSQVGVNVPDKVNDKFFYSYAIGQLKASPDGKKIAAAHFTAIKESDFGMFPVNYFSPGCALTFTYGGILGLYDFDSATGIVSNETVLNALSSERRSYYGVEFSPDSKVLYSSYDVYNFADACGDLYDPYKVRAAVDNYDLTAPSIPASENTLFQLTDQTKSLAGSLQLALDGRIYHAMYHALSYITNPNDYTAAAFHPSGVSIVGCTLGLPPFIASLFDPKILINGEFDTDTFCLGTNMVLTYEGCPDSIIGWDFGDGNTSSAISPAHTYANSGIYTITLSITAPDGRMETKTRQVKIMPLPDVQNAVLKKCPDANGNDISFDLTDAYPLINPNGENVTFSFHLTAQAARDGRDAQPLTHSTASAALFWVRVENEWGCFSIVQLELLFHATPDFNIGTPSKICADSTAILAITTDPGNTVSWFDSQHGTTPIFIGNPFTTPNLTANTSYWVETFNGFCYAPRREITVEVLEKPQIAIETPRGICEGESIVLNATTNGDTVNWYLTNTATVPVFTGTSYEPALLTATSSFWAEAVNSSSGCRSDKMEVVVVVNQQLIPTFNPVTSICAGGTLLALPNISLEGITGIWSPALDNTQTTTYTFTPAAGQCATDQTLVISVNQPLTPTFNAVAAICSGAPLAALPTVSLEGITGTWSPALDNSQTTTYLFTPNTGECAIGQTLRIAVNPSVTPTFHAVAPICFGESLEALPTISLEGITGTWSPPLDNTQTTIYNFTPNAGQCAGSQNLTITVNPSVAATFSAVAPICSGAQLPALPNISLEGITGTWSPVLNNTQTTTYTFTPDSGQCTTTTVPLRIVVRPLITPVFNIMANYCQNGIPEVLPGRSTNGITGTWLPAQINTSSPGTTMYVFSPDNGQCTTGNFSMPVTISGTERPVFNINTSYCQNAVADVLPTISDNGIIGSWSQTSIDTSVPGTRTYTFTPEPGICTVISDQFELTVEVLTRTTPLFQLTTDYYFVESPQILPTISENGITGSWNPSVIAAGNLSVGTYNFVPDSDQCAETFSIEIRVVNFPKFFTPNNDGYQDSWNISALENQSSAQILVYDRFGKILTTINAQSSGWDGTYNGRQMPADDYWFVLTYLDHEGLPREFKAHFALKR